MFALLCCTRSGLVVVFPSEGNHRVDANIRPPTHAFTNRVGVVIIKLSAY